MMPKWAFFEKHENRKWHQKTICLKNRHWDPLKTVLGGAVLNKYEKSMKKQMENQWVFIVQNH